MIILNETDFDKVLNVIEGNVKTGPTFFYSVLNNYISGSVYADSKIPETVLIGTQSGIYFVAGKEDNQEFNDFLFDLYCQRKSKKSRFTLFSPTEYWDCAINEQFKDNIKKMSRYSFVYVNNKRSHDKNLFDSDYSIRRTNEELITNSSEFNEDYYKEYWGSVSNFFKNGFGYCILHKGKIVSECTSIFSSLQFSEIDIVTHEDYRGQGLASINAETFIDHCLENDIMPRWDCDILNKSSIKLAEKLGFGTPVKYSIFV
ncbi:GNAT family N-acetyltransferase [Aneurinibacillus migulanus]|uniref:Acetyltransferase n=1 Tax=Aneurinibacillus migulanus TaxID=47500 RepID=A0A0D1XLE5_ANEMI|nr:GNAT family N-acetyltransferase [Aneurinibacillus migulanus]KIV53083.1 acetyltransferase [Aneurinibacillus migulanus]KON90982.1 acetyltransferase [Aneurinibacillus migulanus]MED0894130.1 GNAT family N-acetyltransferase [Aneurinibacillus migulanus]MED1616861.1 GNAT family N-acetyltransferase [Aneurinibacillus migulanus]